MHCICEICKKKVNFKGFASHLKTHNSNREEYFKVKGRKEKYDIVKEANMKNIRSNSPLCIEFYEKRYGDNAQSEFEKRRKERIKKSKEGSLNKRLSMTDDEYKKYLKEKGVKSKNTTLNNLMAEGLTKEEAIARYNLNKSKCSPRTTIYWVNKGFTKEEAVIKVSEYQSKMSPRTTIYWVNKGFTKEEAVDKVSEYQDNMSDNSLLKRGFTYQDIEDYRKEIKEKAFSTRLEKEGITIEEFLSYKNDKQKYYDLVRYYTTRTINKYHITNIEKRGDTSKEDSYHLDHNYSVSEGFNNSILPELIGSVYNLRMIPWRENILKNSKCGITIEQLLENQEKDIHEHKIKI